MVCRLCVCVLYFALLKLKMWKIGPKASLPWFILTTVGSLSLGRSKARCSSVRNFIIDVCVGVFALLNRLHSWWLCLNKKGMSNVFNISMRSKFILSLRAAEHSPWPARIQPAFSWYLVVMSCTPPCETPWKHRGKERTKERNETQSKTPSGESVGRTAAKKCQIFQNMWLPGKGGKGQSAQSAPVPSLVKMDSKNLLYEIPKT